MEETIHRSPRLLGVDQSRWTLASLRENVSWLGKLRSLAGVHLLLRRLKVVYRRGQQHMHSPDPEYDQKMAAVAAALAQARAAPEKHVFLYEDEFTYYRRPSVAQGYQRRGGPGLPARQGHGSNRKRRVIGALNALSGAVLARQRSRANVDALIRYFRDLEAAYGQAETITIALDNWPVHFHETLLQALAGSKMRLLPLPTYAPWTNPIEKMWRWLKQTVLHQHDFQDDWSGLQEAVARWLDQWTGPSPQLLRYVGLNPG